MTAGRSTRTHAKASTWSARRAPVTIHSIAVVEGSGDRWVLDVACSKGTYIRTLAEDIGEALGCGAHLAALRRTASGRLSIDAGRPLEALEGLGEDALDALLLPAHALVADWPRWCSATKTPADSSPAFAAASPWRMRRRCACTARTAPFSAPATWRAASSSRPAC